MIIVITLILKVILMCAVITLILKLVLNQFNPHMAEPFLDTVFNAIFWRIYMLVLIVLKYLPLTFLTIQKLLKV